MCVVMPMSIEPERGAPAAPKVLVVEDEAGLLFVTSDSLVHDGGFEVIEARSADEAVEILSSRNDIACVFTDVRMPGKIDGLELTRLVMARYPGLPVLMTSGNLRPAERVANVPFLTKPYDLQHLSLAIRALIAEFRPGKAP